MNSLFISYPITDKDIVGNLRHELSEFGVTAWAYSYDKTLGEDVWEEIKKLVNQTKVMVFIVSDNTQNAEGQKRELDLSLNKFNLFPKEYAIFPVLVDNYKFEDLPKELKKINGISITASNVNFVAHEIAKTFFPELLEKLNSNKWFFPKPGDWLKISNLDNIIAPYCKVGDEIYFRRISPMGLFECYYPKINDLFWISPNNVRKIFESIKEEELKIVPKEYQFMTSIEYEMKGRKVASKR